MALKKIFGRYLPVGSSSRVRRLAGFRPQDPSIDLKRFTVNVTLRKVHV